jgi:uncharacterized membrane protein YphA (DoxX/SURF4 family)
MKTEQTRVVAPVYPRIFSVSMLTVLLMVALRIAIGWHFFSEGLSHKNDPKWSSEGFLRQAKGPLAPYYKERLPGFHRWDELMIIPLDEPKSAKPTDDTIAAGGAPPDGEDAPAAKGKSGPAKAVYGKWYDGVVQDWRTRANDIETFYKYTDDQKKNVDAIFNQYADNLQTVLAGYDTDITAYRHGLDRNIEIAKRPGSDNIPNIVKRLSTRAANPTGEPGVSDVKSTPAEWKGDAQALEAAFERDVAELATPDQRKLGTPATAQTGLSLQKIDTIVIWTLIIGGACLVIGLFTRLSAVVLALFLLSVMATQPPWIADSVTMLFNYQLVEFLALILLATSHVGRWAGLDFFVHHLLLRPFRSR